MVTLLKRKSIDIGIFGNKSYGKTITMTALGFMYYLIGYKVFSNYKLKFPHILIESLNDFKKIGLYSKSIPKIMLMEDFEKWLHSRNATSKTNISIDTIVLDNGKNNCSTIYTSKRPMAIDIALRDTTDFFLEVHMILPFKATTMNNCLNKYIEEYWSKDFEKLAIKIDIFDCNMKPKPSIYLFNLKFFGSLYDTQETIEELKN